MKRLRNKYGWVIKFIVIIATFTRCSVDIVQIPDPRQSKSDFFEIDLPLYVGETNIAWHGAQHTEQYFKKTTLSFIESRRFFKKVEKLPKEKRHLPKKYLILDILLSPVYKEHYNWYISFPAIYPIIVIWPFQQTHGSFEVVMKVTLITESGKLLYHKTLKIKNQEIIKMYGFFRPSLWKI